MYHDYTDFNKAYQHPIDEQYLIPPNVRLVYNTYGEKVLNNFRITQHAGQNLVLISSSQLVIYEYDRSRANVYSYNLQFNTKRIRGV